MKGKKHIFTEEQIKYIIDNWNKESIHSMKKRFNCSWYAIASVGKEHNLELPSANTWTNEEINILKEYAKKYTVKTIAKKMNRSEKSILIKCNRLDIKLLKHKRSWTQEDEKELIELWGYFPIEKISKILNRSIYSIKVKAVRLGLGSMIRNNTEILTIYDIVDILKVSRDRIMTWSKRGLKLKKKELSNNRSYYYVEWKDLISFLENNKDLWDASLVETYMLGEEYDWLKEKRRLDFANKPLLYRKWTKSEKTKAINYFKLGYSNEEISKLINCSEWSVSNFLRSQGYFKNKTVWNTEELQFLRENYKNMTYKEIANILNKSQSQIEYKLHIEGLKKVKTLK